MGLLSEQVVELLFFPNGDGGIQPNGAVETAQLEMFYLKRETAFNANAFIGNLGVDIGFLDSLSPEEIAARVREIMKRQVSLFERDGNENFWSQMTDLYLLREWGKHGESVLLLLRLCI